MSDLGAEVVHDLAVVDVGSNSVRLVLYRLEGRALWTVFNEKVLAGLGRDLERTGRLSPDGVEIALHALRRFAAVLEGAQPSATYIAATAAVRGAADGPDFVARVRDEIGLDIRVLSGDDEARLSALGVLAGQPTADGLVGDLGGASLELTCLVDRKPGRSVTLPLGPFSLGAGGPFNLDKVRKLVEERLAGLDDGFESETLHAVGGAWRNLALLQMQLTGYPLKIVDQYDISAADAQAAARLIARQSKSSLERVEGVSRKRAETLPYAAVVLDVLIDRLKIKRVTTSAYGLREGLIFDHVPARLLRLDPLVQGCASLGGRLGTARRLGPALEAWLRPFWAQVKPGLAADRARVVLAAACRLADLGSRLHPDHRADLVFDQVLRAPIAGQSHAERIFLAVAAFARHTAQPPPPETEAYRRVLGSDGQRMARALGLAIRLGCDLSGRAPRLLSASRLRFEDDAVVLTAEPDWADLMLGEQTARRLAALAGVLGSEFRIVAD